MKKLIIVLAAIGLLASCRKDVHLNYPLVVESVTTNFEPCNKDESEYRISVKCIHKDHHCYIYTDVKFNVGDTIR